MGPQKLGAFEVTTVACIDDEERVLLDEEGDLDFEAGFEAGAFGGGGDGVAFDGGFAFDDAECDGVGDDDADGIAIVELNLNVVIFADELEFIRDHIAGHDELFVGFVVHENVVFLIFVVEVLAGDDLEVGEFDAFFGFVGFLKNLFGADIFGFEFDECGAAAGGGGLDGGFEDGEGIAVEQDERTFFEIESRGHNDSCGALRREKL